MKKKLSLAGFDKFILIATVILGLSIALILFIALTRECVNSVNYCHYYTCNSYNMYGSCSNSTKHNVPCDSSNAVWIRKECFEYKYIWE